ncbi:MAG: DNA repair protein RecO [Pseudorhodoplanes sp.]|nr:DNA repair protein RecO [Pseudorhodoplanes sp.]MCQ3943552.1 DNA repair protein RecO [Alphaproteobacteria bacterium]GIK82183.1 MAG: DNA repair protein RecO [Alphaproteobacteria bacterium]
MQWTDEAVVLAVKRHGETSAILDAMTREHGRYLGLVRGGASTRMRPLLQPGNSVRVTWRARLEEHLGTFAVEGLQLRTGALLAASHCVYAVTHLSALTRLLPERDPHASIYYALDVTLGHLDDPLFAAALVVRFELQMLAELGFGLDLDCCAATGRSTDLAYVSPKSGRAVSAEAGEAWRDKLLPLPAFLHGQTSGTPSFAEILQGFALTYFFLCRHVFEPRGLAVSDARQSFIAAVTRALPSAA